MAPASIAISSPRRAAAGRCSARAPNVADPARQQEARERSKLSKVLPMVVHLGLASAQLGVAVSQGQARSQSVPTTTTTTASVDAPADEARVAERDRKQYTIRVGSLRGSASPRWMRGFKQYMRAHSRFDNVNARLYLRRKLGDGYDDLFELKQGRLRGRKARKRCSDDLTTLGDAWLEAAIEEGCVQPIMGAEQTDWWPSLPDKCKRYVSRDRTGEHRTQSPKTASPTAKKAFANKYVWGVPYKWGCLCMLVRQDKIDQLEGGGNSFCLRDWKDLWHPTLKGKLALPKSPRLLVEITLRALRDDDYFTSARRTPEERRAVLGERLRQLRSQAKTFSTEDALKSMKSQQSESELSEQVYVAIGWTHNLLPFSGKSSKLKPIIPRSGTVLTCDLWCVPHYAVPITNVATMVDKWLSFTTLGSQAEEWTAKATNGLKRGSAPIGLLAALEAQGSQGSEAEDAMAEAAVLDASNNFTPPPDLIRRSDFLLGKKEVEAWII